MATGKTGAAQVAARLEALREEIRRHDHLYHVAATPEISDEAYDQLMQQLQALEASHPELVTPDSPSQRVGGAPLEGFTHVRHAVPMLSIDNTYNEAELREFDARVKRWLADADLATTPEYLCDPKIDGVAVSLRYEDGRLVLAATRGDGETGDDITQNVRAVRSVPLRLRGRDWPGVLEVRGEVYWPRPAFDAVNERRVAGGLEPFKNPRNATTGTLKQLDARIVAERGLAFCVHGFGALVPFPAEVRRFSELCGRLRGWGLPVNAHQRLCPDIEAVAAFVHEWDGLRQQMDYETDGLVIKVDPLALRDVLGATSKAPRWCIAYKYAAQQARTRLRAVTLQVGKLGTITPVAELEPVHLAGTTVSRASLHNFDQVARLGLQIGDLVTVEKAGEIIPQVVGVDLAQRPADARPIERPANCPECGGPVQQDEGEVYLRCVNPACPAQRLERLRFFCGRDQMDIDGAGAAVVEALLRSGWVESFADLYKLPQRAAELPELVIGRQEESGSAIRLGARRAEKLLKGIEASRTRPLARLLTALNVRHVGATTAELLAEHFGDVDALVAASAEQLMEVEGIGPEVSGSLHTWLSSEIGRKVIAELRAAGVNLVQPRAPRAERATLAGKTLVVTGTLSRYGRKEIEDLIKHHGGKTSSSVSKKTSYVVAGADAGSKLAKARELGVPVLDETGFEQLLRGEP